MKENILALRAQGKSYKEIVEALGCSLGTVSYHCGEGQKDKSRKRYLARNKQHALLLKCNNFQRNKKLKDKAEDFQRLRFKQKGIVKLGKRNLTFTWKDVVSKFGWNTTCYLTGKHINLIETSTYNLDHIVPSCRGGSNLLDNMGICIKEANAAKNSQTVNEFLQLCKDVLIHHGYKVHEQGADPTG